MRLRREWPSLSWDEFRVLVEGLLMEPKSRLCRHFTPQVAQQASAVDDDIVID